MSRSKSRITDRSTIIDVAFRQGAEAQDRDFYFKFYSSLQNQCVPDGYDT